MINHIRTLLRNTTGAGSGLSGEIGAEFVPPTFQEVSVPGPLVTIHSSLFGSNPDLIMLNYQLRQYMGLLHSTELKEFVLEKDARITYDTLPIDEFFDQAFNTRIQKLLGTATDLAIIGEIEGTGLGGQTSHMWRIRVASGSQVVVTRQTAPQEVSNQDYSLTENLSSLISLPGSTLQARFGAGVGAEWLVTTTVRPTLDLGTTLANLGAIGGSVMDDLFHVGSEKGVKEPFLTFKNLWKNHPELAYRMGAVLLAWAYQADDLRELQL